MILNKRKNFGCHPGLDPCHPGLDPRVLYTYTFITNQHLSTCHNLALSPSKHPLPTVKTPLYPLSKILPSLMARNHTYSVYILSNYSRTVFYIGVTNDLWRRVQQHRNGEGRFTSKYKCFDLVYYEDFSDIRNAIAREKQLKNWKREWKIKLIRRENPELKDLADRWYE